MACLSKKTVQKAHCEESRRCNTDQEKKEKEGLKSDFDRYVCDKVMQKTVCGPSLQEDWIDCFI